MEQVVIKRSARQPVTPAQISELKDHLDQIPTSAHAQDDLSEDIAGPDLLFGRQRHATKQELLASLPPRSEADQLIEAYFESMDTAPALLHRPSFLREVRVTKLVHHKF